MCDFRGSKIGLDIFTLNHFSLLQGYFPFKHTEDFNQTTHVAPYGPIVFIDNISINFNSLSSVQYVLKESQMVT